MSQQPGDVEGVHFGHYDPVAGTVHLYVNVYNYTHNTGTPIPINNIHDCLWNGQNHAGVLLPPGRGNGGDCVVDMGAYNVPAGSYVQTVAQVRVDGPAGQYLSNYQSFQEVWSPYMLWPEQMQEMASGAGSTLAAVIPTLFPIVLFIFGLLTAVLVLRRIARGWGR